MARAPGSPIARLLEVVRLVHPFPSVLDGVVVGVVAVVEGGAPKDAILLGLSMTALQFAIGATNDVVDSPVDAGRPSKPIVAGLVSRRVATAVAAGSAVIGLALAARSVPVAGVGILGLAIVVLGIGLAYDLWAKGTALSWLPFALGIPILPVYGWLGATGSLPQLFVVLVPVAAVAGAALAIANALIDLERDRDAGIGSIALALGRGPAATLVMLLHAAVASVALLTIEAWQVPSGWATVAAATAGIPLFGAALGAVGALRGGPAVRERAWEVQALGSGVLASAWIAAVTSTSPG